MPGLSISRRAGEAFWIETGVGDIRVEVFRIGRGQAKVWIEAPAAMRIVREELLCCGGGMGAEDSRKGGTDGPVAKE